jgi:hypothetical protein
VSFRWKEKREDDRNGESDEEAKKKGKNDSGQNRVDM